MKIAVIGGGWYGCHIASYLNNLGFECSLFEQNNEIFLEASGKNQNRLHLGFHYARDYQTRFQSRTGFDRFLERYGFLTRRVDLNLYAVPIQHSLLDFRTYKMIVSGSGIEFEEIHLDKCPISIKNISGVILTERRVLLVREAREYFANVLKSNVRYNTKVTLSDIVEREDCVLIHGEEFDFVVDATWCTSASSAKKTFFMSRHYCSTIRIVVRSLRLLW